MARGEESKRALRGAFVYEGLPLEAAAQKHGIPITTASRWKRQAKTDGDDWDKARAAARMSGEEKDRIIQEVIEDYLRLHRDTIEQIRGDMAATPIKKAEALSRLADAFHKTMHAMGSASPELSRLAVANEVLRRLSEFVIKEFPKHGPAFIEILEPFGIDLARHYG